MGRIIDLIKTFFDALKIFRRNYCLDRAAAISFFALFSIFPILFIITAGLGFILGTRAELADRVIEMAKANIPYITPRMVNDFKALTHTWKALGWIGVVTLIISAEMVLGAVAEALISVFDVREKYGYLRKKLINILVLAVGFIVSLASIFVMAVAKIFDSIDVKLFGFDVADFLIQSFTFRHLLPFLFIVAAVTIVYRMFSGPNLSMRYALYGALIFGAMWELARNLFALYITYIPTYNRLYGSLGALILLLAWIYFSANILLFSAALARAAFKRAAARGAGKRAGRAA